MTIERAIRRCEAIARFRRYSLEDGQAIRIVLASLAETQRERDRLIACWPSLGAEFGTVYRVNRGPYAGRWFVSGQVGDYSTLEAAVRAAVGLDARGGPDDD